MRLFTADSSKRSGRNGLIGLIFAAGLLAAAQPASAATWGHLRGPFAPESLYRERANFAAEERSIRREMRMIPAGYRTAWCNEWDRVPNGYRPIAR